MDNDIGHDTQKALDALEERILYLEEAAGIQPEEDTEEAEVEQQPAPVEEPVVAPKKSRRRQLEEASTETEESTEVSY